MRLEEKIMKRPAVALATVAAIGGMGLVSLGPATATAAENAATVAAAAERTATFSVERMTCASCPITVRMAIEAVPGVKSVEVDFESKTATVVFDPAVATIEAIAAASANAGYPATPQS